MKERVTDDFWCFVGESARTTGSREMEYGRKRSESGGVTVRVYIGDG